MLFFKLLKVSMLHFRRFTKCLFLDENLPTMISMCADAIIKAESAARKRELEEAAGTWEGKLLKFVSA